MPNFVNNVWFVESQFNSLLAWAPWWIKNCNSLLMINYWSSTLCYANDLIMITAAQYLCYCAAVVIMFTSQECVNIYRFAHSCNVCTSFRKWWKSSFCGIICNSYTTSSLTTTVSNDTVEMYEVRYILLQLKK